MNNLEKEVQELKTSISDMAAQKIVRESEEKIEQLESTNQDLREQLEDETISNPERIETEINENNEEIASREKIIETEQNKMSLRFRVKEIFKKYGLIIIGVASAITTVIGVIVSNLSSNIAKVSKKISSGLKNLGRQVAKILPGIAGAIASFIFKTAGEVVGFLAKNSWLLIVAVVIFVIDEFKKKSRKKK